MTDDIKELLWRNRLKASEKKMLEDEIKRIDSMPVKTYENQKSRIEIMECLARFHFDKLRLELNHIPCRIKAFSTQDYVRYYPDKYLLWMMERINYAGNSLLILRDIIAEELKKRNITAEKIKKCDSYFKRTKYRNITASKKRKECND